MIQRRTLETRSPVFDISVAVAQGAVDISVGVPCVLAGCRDGRHRILLIRESFTHSTDLKSISLCRFQAHLPYDFVSLFAVSSRQKPQRDAIKYNEVCPALVQQLIKRRTCDPAFYDMNFISWRPTIEAKWFCVLCQHDVIYIVHLMLIQAFTCLNLLSIYLFSNLLWVGVVLMHFVLHFFLLESGFFFDRYLYRFFFWQIILHSYILYTVYNKSNEYANKYTKVTKEWITFASCQLGGHIDFMYIPPKCFRLTQLQLAAPRRCSTKL